MADDAAEFHRGPHDGLVLTMEEIKRSCHLVMTQNGDEERLFVMMPSLSDWERVIEGEIDKDGPFHSLYPYELERGGDGAVFIFRGNDEFTEAVDEN